MWNRLKFDGNVHLNEKTHTISDTYNLINSTIKSNQIAEKTGLERKKQKRLSQQS